MNFEYESKNRDELKIFQKSDDLLTGKKIMWMCFWLQQNALVQA
ncbi:MAG: hypothetical protein JWQ35_928 [Bacteriovoracaceae bacterium]|nr:hypothetical protein [Bacteriovoracaceae bacterium]